MILSRGNQYVVFMGVIYFLQLSNGFESNKIHPVFIRAKNALCFNGYFHRVHFYKVEEPFFSVFTNFLFIPFIRNKLTTIMTNNKGSLLIDFLN